MLCLNKRPKVFFRVFWFVFVSGVQAQQYSTCPSPGFHFPASNLLATEKPKDSFKRGNFLPPFLLLIISNDSKVHWKYNQSKCPSTVYGAFMAWPLHIITSSITTSLHTHIQWSLAILVSLLLHKFSYIRATELDVITDQKDSPLFLHAWSIFGQSYLKRSNIISRKRELFYISDYSILVNSCMLVTIFTFTQHL